MSRSYLIAFVLFIVVVTTNKVMAEIPPHYNLVAYRNGIPPTVLYGIALQESRPPSGFNGIAKPWPWSLNCDGKSYYLDSKAQAYNFSLLLISVGESCDIGLMQVSWRWHKSRFTSLYDSFDPYTNIQVGADILKEQYELKNDWKSAVGAYHSPSNNVRAARYSTLVEKHITAIQKDLN